MSLNAALSLFLDEYPKAVKREFTKNDVAQFVREDLPSIISEAISASERYTVQGSVGQGNWARVPWIAVFDKLITETAQSGYYVVYLPDEDFRGVYLSLNQGVTTARNIYGTGAKEALRARSRDFLARIGELPEPYIMGPIDLKVRNPSSLGAYYEQGSICAKFYCKDNLPSDADLEGDLANFIEFYFALATKELLSSSVASEEDEENLNWEDLRFFREHKRIERNKSLVAKVKKKQGYKCRACKFEFVQMYGDLGKKFIEAHHLTPLSKLKGQKVSLDPELDFAILCSNCHRMIHRSEFVSEVEKFKDKYVR